MKHEKVAFYIYLYICFQGNVNVQANTAPGVGRPMRPFSTRINNRGPPRITDLPALPPDFDVPALPPPPLGMLLI